MLQSSLYRAFTSSRCACQQPASRLILVRHLFTSSRLLLPRKSSQESTQDPQTSRRTRSVLEDDMDELWEQIEEAPEVEDSPSLGHIFLQDQRELLHYMRLIEHEMPKLVAYRIPFIPATDEQPVIVRSMHYQGEPHPAAVKRVIVVPVDGLPLKDEAAIHKFILLAGPNWSPVPPADSGVSGLDDWGSGYVKISCEDFPRPSQNLKWASDTLDKLIEEANNGKDKFADIPMDARHVLSKVRKEKRGGHVPNQLFLRPTIRDFPQAWLPEPSA